MESFLENCGVGALEVAVGGEGAGEAPQRRRFGRPYLLIGRDARNDVRLDDPGVSRRHAYVQAVGGRLYCVDLASRTGVHWPGGPQASGWVEWDQPLRIGRSLIRVSPPSAGPRCTALMPKAQAEVPAPPADVCFEITGGAAPPARWRMQQAFALAGGAAACRVRLRHDRVSPFHCGLVQGPLGLWVVDLLSRYGTRVNDQTVTWARLTEGDRLQVGPFVLHCRREPPAVVRGAATAALATAGRAAVPAPRSVAQSAPDQSLLPPILNEFQRMQQQMLDQFHQTMLMMAEMFSTLHREQAGLVREELAEMRRLTGELNALKAEQARQALDRPPGPADGPERPDAGARPPVGAAERVPVKSAGPASAGVAAPAVRPIPASPDVHDWLSRRVAELQEERDGRWQKILHFITGGKNP